jgi:hypothetical protein
MGAYVEGARSIRITRYPAGSYGTEVALAGAFTRNNPLWVGAAIAERPR